MHTVESSWTPATFTSHEDGSRLYTIYRIDDGHKMPSTFSWLDGVIPEGLDDAVKNEIAYIARLGDIQLPMEADSIEAFVAATDTMVDVIATLVDPLLEELVAKNPRQAMLLACFIERLLEKTMAPIMD